MSTSTIQVLSGALTAGGQGVVQGLLGETLKPLTQASLQAGNPTDAEGMDFSLLLASLSSPCARLQSLITGLAMTQAHALLHRAPEVGAFASQLKVCNMLSL